MRIRTLLAIIILAAFSFGGSFTCNSSDDKKNTTVTVN